MDPLEEPQERILLPIVVDDELSWNTTEQGSALKEGQGHEDLVEKSKRRNSKPRRESCLTLYRALSEEDQLRVFKQLVDEVWGPPFPFFF